MRLFGNFLGVFKRVNDDVVITIIIFAKLTSSLQC